MKLADERCRGSARQTHESDRVSAMCADVQPISVRPSELLAEALVKRHHAGEIHERARHLGFSRTLAELLVMVSGAARSTPESTASWASAGR